MIRHSLPWQHGLIAYLNMAAAAVILVVGVAAWDGTRTRPVTVFHRSREWATKGVAAHVSSVRVFLNHQEHPYAVLALICVSASLLIGGTTVSVLRRGCGGVTGPRVP